MEIDTIEIKRERRWSGGENRVCDKYGILY